MAEEHAPGFLYTPPAPRRRRTGLLIALALSLLIALALWAYALLWMQLPLPGSLGRAWSALTLPSVLQEARLVSVSPRGTDVYVRAGLSYAHEAHIGGAARLLAPTERGGYAALARDPEGANQRLIVDGLLVAEGPSIRSFAASTDGRRIAYVETADGSGYSTDPAGWVVKVYYPDPQTVQDVGPGFAPFFIDDSTLGFFTAAGLFAVDLETGLPRALSREPVTHPRDAVLVSPDRSHIAWEDTDDRLHVFALADSGVEEIGVFSLDEVAGAASWTLGDAGIYAVRPTNVGSEVWQRRFDGSLARIATLPPSLETTAIVFIPN